MRYWAIPITIVEYGRVAIIKADTKQEALRIFRKHGWESCTDPSHFKVTKIGPCVEDK